MTTAKAIAEKFLREAPVRTYSVGDLKVHVRTARDDVKADAIYATKKDGRCVSNSIFLPMVETALKDAGVEITEDNKPHVIARELIKLRRSDTEAVLKQLGANQTLADTIAR